jgi:hypothetical protein
MKILLGPGQVSYEIDDKTVETFFKWLYETMDRQVKKSCYIIQYSNFLILNWYGALSETFGQLVDASRGKDIIYLPEKSKIGEFSRRALFQPVYERLEDAIKRAKDIELSKDPHDSKIEEEFNLFISIFADFYASSIGQKNEWMKEIERTNRLEVSAVEIGNWLRDLNAKRRDVHMSALSLERTLQCDQNLFQTVAQGILRRFRPQNNIRPGKQSFIQRLKMLFQKT